MQALDIVIKDEQTLERSSQESKSASSSFSNKHAGEEYNFSNLSKKFTENPLCASVESTQKTAELGSDKEKAQGFLERLMETCKEHQTRAIRDQK